MYWPKLSFNEIQRHIENALARNKSYYKDHVLGIPATYLDSRIFPIEEPFLKKAPFLHTLVENPNHIGVHTLSESMEEWHGTQSIELDVIRLVAEEIFSAEVASYDGYIATGGTEANIQGIWIYRNYYRKEKGLSLSEILLMFSEDSHYSMPKAANLLGLKTSVLPVSKNDRKIVKAQFEQRLKEAVIKGIKGIILVLNMGTTMFGSIDDIGDILRILHSYNIDYKVHIDAAFGGFLYPFTNINNPMNFLNPSVSSISVDAHKMLQAPYGTGIFLCRQDLIKYVESEDAGYITGHDHTLCGSRSGANVIAIWMILMAYGSDEWKEHVRKQIKRTDELCDELDELRVKYFRQEYMNIVTLESEYISTYLAKKYFLVPETHVKNNRYWKIVVMDHVKDDELKRFLFDFKRELKKQRIH